jgi:periplasmic protein TonB
MFNNLIESSSHHGELKRRGTFFLFTTGTYAVVLIIASVASIYAYDTRLEQANIELVTLLNPIEFIEPASIIDHHGGDTPKGGNSNQPIYERKIAMARVDQSNVAPKDISTTPNQNMPLPGAGIVRIGYKDANPGLPGGAEGSVQSINGNKRPGVIEVGTLPPLPPEKPRQRTISKGAITSEALFLPKPAYPAIPKQLKIQGPVKIQVLIDEQGNVISAHAISGHPMLTAAAQQAALQARFSPTLLGDQPVKVSGVITYNFVLQ